MISTIYEPKGRAEEYSHLALNLMTGCPFRCTYCYCPQALHIQREQFHSRVEFRPGVIGALRQAAPKFAGTDKRVLLSFVGDVFCRQAIDSGVTEEALEILREHDIPFQTLSKAGLAAEYYLSLYRPGVDLFAVTLTSKDSSRIEGKFEPSAAPWWARIAALCRARQMGIGTWVSCEPILDPAATLTVIRQAAPYTDLFKIGTLNHQKSDINWREFGINAIRLCESLGVAYYLKRDLARHLDGVPFRNTDNRRVGKGE